MTLCGADCSGCGFREKCKGCIETDGRPFGGRCVAAEYIKKHDIEKYREYKKATLDEVNTFLDTQGIPHADNLYEICGGYVNPAYAIPSGDTIKFLSDRDVYLGCQIETGAGYCYGVAVGMDFILVSAFGTDGEHPMLIAYRKR